MIVMVVRRRLVFRVGLLGFLRRLVCWFLFIILFWLMGGNLGFYDLVEEDFVFFGGILGKNGFVLIVG